MKVLTSEKSFLFTVHGDSEAERNDNKRNIENVLHYVSLGLICFFMLEVMITNILIKSYYLQVAAPASYTLICSE